MAKTAQMRLIELMLLKEDIRTVIEYIGKKGSFQFQDKKIDTDVNDEEEQQKDNLNVEALMYDKLLESANYLGIKDFPKDLSAYTSPDKRIIEGAQNYIEAFTHLKDSIEEANKKNAQVEDACKEAKAFSNLQVSYSELEHLSFLSFKIGKIPAAQYDQLQDSLMDNAILIPLGEDKSHVLIASSKKGRFAVESELKKVSFVEMEVPHDFKGIPQDVLESLEEERKASEKELKELETEKTNFVETHKSQLIEYLGSYTIALQIQKIEKKLESTQLVYRITGWIPEADAKAYMTDLDQLTQGRIAIRLFEPYEVPSVVNGKEQVPVKLENRKFVKSFERMIFSYGSPIYGTIDPTPFVAIFFTILFGIMFGDLGQGLVFVLLGILMAAKVIKVGGWNKFAPIFIAIGCTSSIMGLLTGEFFSNESLLEPFSEWVTGFFGNPHAPILKMMPSSDPSSIVTMFAVFGVAVGIGFIINTMGLIINIINNFIQRKYAEAIFGKNGIAGAVFFWYVIALVIRVLLFHHTIALYDWIVIGVSLFFAAFAEPFENLVEGKRPLLENGLGTYLISSIVEVIEVVSGYLSNTISFVRVGAFALSHAVLDYVIYILTQMCGGSASAGGILVLIFGNALIIVLEGMIVAIQVIRLQYYEFFSKFFNEIGKEFKPFKFEII